MYSVYICVGNGGPVKRSCEKYPRCFNSGDRLEFDGHPVEIIDVYYVGGKVQLHVEYVG